MGDETFGQNVRRALADHGHTIQWLADQLELPHSTVSSWLTKGRPPDPLTVFEVERLVGLAPGMLSRPLGYLPLDASVPTTTAEMIAVDPALDDVGRRGLLAAYHAMVER